MSFIAINMFELFRRAKLTEVRFSNNRHALPGRHFSFPVSGMGRHAQARS